MNLNVHRLRIVYDTLREFPPFCHWGLPPSSAIKFKAAKTRDWRGLYWRAPHTKDYEISVSATRHGRLDSVFCTMAHEMVHLYQDITRTDTPNATHNRDFYRLGRRVARELGFDPKDF